MYRMLFVGIMGRNFMSSLICTMDGRTVGKPQIQVHVWSDDHEKPGSTMFRNHAMGYTNWCKPVVINSPFSVQPGNHVWSPYFKIDVNKIESVQKRFTKACMPKFSYSARLSVLGLQTLETRRIMSDRLNYMLHNIE